METYILIGYATISTALFIGAFSVASKLYRKLQGIGRVRYDLLTELTDLQYIEEKPARIKIGEKHIFVNLLSTIEMPRFRQDLYNLLLYFRSVGLQLDFLLPSEIDVSDSKVQGALMVIGNKQAQKRIVDIICKYLLDDKRFNPEKVTRRYLMKHSTELDLLAIFYTLYDFNTRVKKNAKYLLERMAGKITDTSPIQSLMDMDTQQINSVKRVSEQYALWLQEEGKEIIDPTVEVVKRKGA